MKNKIVIILVFILFTQFVNCSIKSEKDHPELLIYCVPGKNGLGSCPSYVEKILNQGNAVAVGTPFVGADLGQEICINFLRDAISMNNQECLVYATSQGTATALNYLVQDQGKMIKGLVLESVLVSGNRAIEYAIGGPLMPLNFLTEFSSFYYLIPYFAKLIFPFYCPGGMQPIKSIENIPTSIPIIIIHSEDDYQLSYDDAYALYSGLRLAGNENVYLIIKEGSTHLHIIEHESERKLIRSILKKHKLIKSLDVQEDLDLSTYQPDYKRFEKLYFDILYKEKKHENLRTYLQHLSVIIVFGSFCILVKLCIDTFGQY